jgi:hypothetical protein
MRERRLAILQLNPTSVDEIQAATKFGGSLPEAVLDTAGDCTVELATMQIPGTIDDGLVDSYRAGKATNAIVKRADDVVKPVLKRADDVACAAPNRGAGQIADQVAGPGQRLAGQIATIANKRPFVDRLKDVTANPSRWKVVRSVTEPAKGMHNRGGRSLQELLRNEETGETIVRHTLFKANGGIFDPAHFRDIWK